MEDDLVVLGQRIEEARLAEGLSAREVAERAGVSPAYLRAIERGSNPKTRKPSRPSADNLVAIARVVRLEPEDLLGLAGYDPSTADAFTADASSAPATGAPEDFVRQIQESLKGLNRRSRFMHEQALRRLEQFSAEFRVMAGGSLPCSPEEERVLTRSAVQQCRSHLRAVSYQDEPWWRTQVGEVYLDLHEEVMKKNGVEMTRIFLIEEGALPELRPALQRHLDLGIQTYVLTLDAVSDQYWRDFVVYDESLLRTAVSTDITQDRKTAEFTDDPGRIKRALSDFETLRRIARSQLAEADRVLTRLSR